MKKYQLTEDMAQYRKYRMTNILAGPAQGDGQERCEEGEKAILKQFSLIYRCELGMALRGQHCKQKYIFLSLSISLFICCHKVQAFIATSGSLRSRDPERVYRPIWLHCDVLHITTKWVSSLTLDCNGVFAI